MAGYPSLTHIGIPLLVSAAGGDPWQVDGTLQDGDPAELSRAFFDAGICCDESYGEFTRAQAQFRDAWNREHGEHPINDSAEVHRATTSLLFNRDRIPAIASTLAGIAAGLAQAQRSSAQWIVALDTDLRAIDEAIGRALADQQDTSMLEDQAVDCTTVVLSQVKSFRDTYSSTLNSALCTLRADDRYDPAIDDVDGDGDGTAGVEQRGRTSIDYYEANQRAADEALLADTGTMTDEKKAAADRLRDVATATDPAADEAARALAAERIDDFRMSQFVGPLPIDPLVGGDARSRAQGRLDLQRRLESGSMGLPPMAVDRATAELDAGEHFARVVTAQQAMNTFTALGMSRAGAHRAVGLLSQGTPLRDLLGQDSTMLGGVNTGLDAAIRSAPVNLHAAERFSEADLAILKRLSKGAKFGGLGIDTLLGVRDVMNGDATALGVAGRVAGGAAVGWAAETAAWAGLGSFVGPEGALAAGLIASILLSDKASDVGERVFDELGS